MGTATSSTLELLDLQAPSSFWNLHTMDKHSSEASAVLADQLSSLAVASQPAGDAPDQTPAHLSHDLHFLRPVAVSVEASCPKYLPVIEAWRRSTFPRLWPWRSSSSALQEGTVSGGELLHSRRWHSSILLRTR